MASSGMLRRVTLVNTDVSEELSVSLLFLRSMRRLLVTASVAPISPILLTLMDALSSSETSIFTRTTRHNFEEDSVLHSHRRENLKSYKIKICYFYFMDGVRRLLRNVCGFSIYYTMKPPRRRIYLLSFKQD
jgi:hypothetical protein